MIPACVARQATGGQVRDRRHRVLIRESIAAWTPSPWSLPVPISAAWIVEVVTVQSGHLALTTLAKTLKL